MVERTTLVFMENCEEAKNLTPAELRGMRKLRKRVETGEVVLYITDKSSKFCLATKESNSRQGAEHVSGDQPIE